MHQGANDSVPSVTLNLKHQYPGLDSLRATAIVIVVLFHLSVLFPHPPWLDLFTHFGWIGVDLFFVLSGFLIAGPLFATLGAKEKISFRTFFIKRFFRIIPAYLVVLLLYLSFPVLRERGTPAPAWKFLTFSQNLGLDLRTQGAFSHAWSLCVEEQFYFFFPLILMGLAYFKQVQKGFVLLAIFFLGGMGIRYFIWNNLVYPFLGTDQFGNNWQEWIYYPTYARLDGLLFGILIAGIFQFKPILKLRLEPFGNRIFLLGLLLLALSWILFVDQRTFALAVFGFPMIDLGCAFLVLGALLPTSLLFRFKSKWIASVALWSYSIYLIHKMVIHVTQDWLISFSIGKESNLSMVISLSLTLFAAFLLNQFVEKPFMKLRSHFLLSEVK